jgi:futalosine hydrolase
VDVLVVVATPGEGTWVRPPARLLVCGVGPVEAAVATAAALAERDPMRCCMPEWRAPADGRDLRSGAVVVGTESRYTDLAARLDGLERLARPDAALLARVTAALPEAEPQAIATSAAVAGSTSAAVEAMEGFGVLRAATLAGVPAVELRVVANEVEEDDRERWDIAGALRVLSAVGPRAMAAIVGA